jgi:acyl carrier protein
MNEPTAPEAEYDPFARADAVELASTPGQRELWLSSHAGAGAGRAYNETFSIELKGRIDDAALLAGLEALADFHEALRGHFSEDGERFVIEPSLSLDVARHDLASVPAGDRGAALLGIEASATEAPFDLEAGPLFRAAIVRMAEDERAVLLCAHHAVCDGWSLDVLLADLGRLYSSFAEGAPLPEPPRHGFSDYAAYCGSPEYRSKAEKSMAFWKRKLGPLPPPLSLPCDGERPARRSYGARYAQRALPGSLLAEAKGFARAHGMSFFAVLLSAYAAMIRRLAGASDFVVGIPIAGHPEAGMEDCVGDLVNMVPIRFAVDPGLSFLGLCAAANEAVMDARENASVGFADIVAGIGVPRDPSRVPLVAAVFTHVQRYAPEKLRFGALSVEYRLAARSSEAFELNFNAIESKDGIELQAHANAALFSSAWIERRLCEFERFLAEGCRSPGSPVDELPVAPEKEAGVETSEAGGAAREHSPPTKPAEGRRPAKAAPASPSLSSIERSVREIWARQLGNDEYGDDANLFDVGGNSFIALRIVLEAEKAFGREIDLAVLFQYSTIAAFARFIAEGTDGGVEAKSGDTVADRVRRRRESMGE